MTKWISINKYKKGYELCVEQKHNGLTYEEILNKIKGKYEIADYPLLQKLRNHRFHKCFEDFWVFVPNPDMTSWENDYVSWFFVNSVKANLDCDEVRSGSYSNLGVFLIRRKK